MGFSQRPEIYSLLTLGKLVQWTAGQARLENTAPVPQIAYLQRKKEKKKMTDRPSTILLVPLGHRSRVTAKSRWPSPRRPGGVAPWAGTISSVNLLTCPQPWQSGRAFVPPHRKSALTLSWSPDAERPKSWPLGHSVQLCPGLGFFSRHPGVRTPTAPGLCGRHKNTHSTSLQGAWTLCFAQTPDNARPPSSPPEPDGPVRLTLLLPGWPELRSCLGPRDVGLFSPRTSSLGCGLSSL